MKVPKVKLSGISQKAAKSILKASKDKSSIWEQMKMANYYAYLHSDKNVNVDKLNYAKLTLGK